MSEPHRATVRWRRHADEAFTDHRYHRAHAWWFDGGAEVAASSSPHVVRVPFSDPAAVDPEEAFVASLSSCHLLWFLDHAARAGLRVDAYEDDAEGEMGPMPDDARKRVVMQRVTLRPFVRFAVPVPAEVVERLHHAAHEDCFLANSVRCEVRCEPRFDDAASSPA